MKKTIWKSILCAMLVTLTACVYVLDNAVVCKVKIAEEEKMCGQCRE